MQKSPPPEFEALANTPVGKPAEFDAAVDSPLPLGDTADFGDQVRAMKKALRLFKECIDNENPDKGIREKVSKLAIAQLDGRAKLFARERKKGGVLEIAFEPTDKITLAWCRLLRAVIDEEIWRSCLYCNAHFHATTRRQRFCCDSHRAASHTASKTEDFADLLVERGVDKRLIDEVLGELGRHKPAKR
tara:strand:+ start:345 stop:911 length:567 start_codon:yes stop_codon:yes gene_type:complete